MPREVPQPSVHLADFACPNCGAHSTQRWFAVHAAAIGRGTQDDTPKFIDIDRLSAALKAERDPENRKVYESLVDHYHKIEAGLPFIKPTDNNFHNLPELCNAYVSRCFTCSGVALWVYDRIVFPPQRLGVEPNSDLPDEIRADVDEARAIVNLSPRGAAALLRLAVQKLCKHLGEPGKDINQDIASLVKKGLDPIIQQALDAVRVVGNHAVHPGQMDIKDDPSTVAELVDVINLIADQLISKPKKVAALYARLPEDKRRAIEVRDAPKVAAAPAAGQQGTTT